MNIKASILRTIGGTPLVMLNRVTHGIDATVCAKLEQFNPMTSIKDRPALAMIEHAQAEGRLQPGSIIAEATSGNTGLALAMVGAVYGYRVILFVEELDRLKTITEAADALGAEIVVTDRFATAVSLAEQFQKDNPMVFSPQQFKNDKNPYCHESTTAEEIIADAGASLRAFVAGAGSGGTITGVGRVLKKRMPSVEVVLAEPDTVRMYSGGTVSCSEIHGVGPTFKPQVMDTSVVDSIIQVNSADAHHMMRRLAREEGILCGPSSGALAHAAIQVAKRYGPGDVVVTVFPDYGMRYLGTGMYCDGDVARPTAEQ